MKGIFSRLTPRWQFALLLLTEVLLGASYIGIVLLRETGGVLPLILQYIYDLLHTVAIVVGIVLALRCANGRRIYHVLPSLATLLVVLFVKDVLVTFYSLTAGDGYYAGDAVFLALSSAALNTLLFTGLFLILVAGGAYLFFLYARPASPAPTDMWSLSASSILAATCFVAVADTLPKWIKTLVEQILFLSGDAMWLPTASELVTMAFDLILIPAFGVAAYMVAYLSLRFSKEKDIPKQDASA